MAYKITATTDTDKELLEAVRTLAWQRRVNVSEIIREAFSWVLEGIPLLPELGDPLLPPRELPPRERTPQELRDLATTTRTRANEYEARADAASRKKPRLRAVKSGEDKS